MTTGHYAPDRVELIALKGLPRVEAGMDLAALIAAAVDEQGLALEDDDIVVVAQKIVSKAEGRTIRLEDVQPCEEALRRAAQTGKDPAVVQLILDESNEIVRQGEEVIIAEHRLGFVMAHAGVDQSNSAPGEAILLPEDPDASAQALRLALGAKSGRRIAVLIIDSIGRAWRNGTVGHTIGVAGIRPLVDLRQTRDLAGRPMEITEVGLADEIAAGASALMGQGAEAKPVVIVRGFHDIGEERVSSRALLRPRSQDLFR